MPQLPERSRNTEPAPDASDAGPHRASREPAEPPDDHELVRRVRRGDDAAFASLVARHHEKLFRVVRGILGDWQDTEDALQEVFVNVYTRIDGFRHDASLSTWLYRVAVNTALKARKRRARRAMASLTTDRGDEPAAEDSLSGRIDGEELLDKLLRPLPDHLRAVILLKEKEGLSYREIASVLECTPGAVEQRIHRAIVTLREVWKSKLDTFGWESLS